MRKFYHWLLKHDEKQREQIAELSALVADAKLNTLLDQTEIARLRMQIATLEYIMELETKKTTAALHPYSDS